jgi:ribose 5-phosphate isomerase B
MIYIGSDHAGFPLKQEMMKFLSEKGLSYKECGCLDGKSFDYPIAAKETCEAMLADDSSNDTFAILVCGTGIGISIAANKIKGVRAAVVTDAYTAEMSRRHNNANAICFGARVTGAGVALSALEKYLETSFEGGRHERRVNQIMSLE